MIGSTDTPPAVIFAMTYPDNEGNVWDRIAHLYDLTAERLRERNINSLIAYPKLTGKPSCKLEHLEIGELDLRRFDGEHRSTIGRWIAQRRVSVIVYMDMDPGPVPFSWLHQQGVRTVNFSQYNFADDMGLSWPRRTINHLRGRLGLKHHDLYVANSRHQHHLLVTQLGIPVSRLNMAVNGVDTELFKPATGSSRPDPSRWHLPVTDHYAISVCQARPEKRVDFLVDVAHRVFEREPNLSLTFMHAGDGGQLANWKAKAKALGLADRFHFLGKHTDLTPLYHLADVMLHAPSRESFGYVIAEAMACGLPVICSNVGGPREIIEHERTGYLLDLNDVNAYADAVIQLVKNETLRRRMGDAGRARVVGHFHIDEQAQRMAGLIADQVPALCTRSAG